MSQATAPGGPLHMLYPHAGSQQYLQGTLAYVQAARAADAAVVIAAPPQRRDALAAHLGTKADEDVAFLDTAALGRNPARLLAAWQTHIDRHADGRPVHGVNDTAATWSDERYSGEARYTEWLLNQAFTTAGAWSLLCPIDTGTHPAPWVQALSRCHPLLWDGAASAPAADYLTGPYTLEQLPDPPPDAQYLLYTVDTLPQMRATLTVFARRHHLPDARTRDLILVASELATNSILHGGGEGRAHLWRDGDALACEFRDQGVISDPLAGRLRPRPNRLGGRGLWFVNQLCDLVQLRSEPGRGTRIRIWIDLPAPESTAAKNHRPSTRA